MHNNLNVNKKVTMFEVFKNRLEVTGTLWTVTALRISAGRSTEPIGSDLPVIKDALGRPLIPGSSFKGALRSRLESFLRGIVDNDRKLVANPASQDEWSLTSSENQLIKSLTFEELITLNEVQENQPRFEELITLIRRDETEIPENISLEYLIRHIREFLTKGEFLTRETLNSLKKQYTPDLAFTSIIKYHTDIISHLFGSPWIASKFQVRDLSVVSDAWFGQYQERDGVAIDRDTETAADAKLYDFQVVPAGTPFEFRAVVENAEEWELGLLMIGLHQFESEHIPLGGGRSRGLGVVRLDIDKMRWVDVEDNPQFLLQYLQKLVMEDDTAYEDAADYKDHWVQKLVDYLTNKARTQNQTAATRD